MPDLETLIEKLESVESKHLGIPKLEHDVLQAFHDDVARYMRGAPYLRSVDAALGLFSAVLPGWNWDKCGPSITLSRPEDNGDADVTATHTDVPIAITMAVLKALQAKEANP